MSAVLASASVVPVLAEPSLRSEQVTQLLLGEGAVVQEERDQMLRIRTSFDGYQGWVHSGYVHRVDHNRHDGWLQTAAWSSEAEVSVDEHRVAVPRRGRLVREGNDRARLPDGRAVRLVAGRLDTAAEMIAAAQAERPAVWAWRAFGGAPYLWGGLTRGGIDCSGLVQQTFAARGIPLPRDARDQVSVGQVVPPDQIGPDDLLYFRGASTDRITHVALAETADLLVHATVTTGRVTREIWREGQRAASLRPLLVAVRRLA